MAETNSLQDLAERYERVKNIDQQKNKLIDDLLYRLSIVEDAYQRAVLDHDRESRFNREVQLKERELQDQLRRAKAIMDRDPFVLVLLDGDGMIFEDTLLQKGEQGGKEAASRLWTSVRDYVARELPHISSPKITTRIYANVKGLADTCYKANIIDAPSIFEDFVRGFTGSKLLFDFVDVGTGKDRADDKLSEIFKLYLYDCHCHQILLGCSHDNGYARLLEDTLSDNQITRRVSLLEGVPFERELATLKASFKTAKFDTLFRDHKIVNPTWGLSQPQTPLSTLSPNQPSLHLARATSNSNSTDSSNNQVTSPGPTAASTWATMTAAPFVPSLPPSRSQSTSVVTATPGFDRNRFGQRIDPPMKPIPKDEVDRVKKLKACNVHFLQGNCQNERCQHSHTYKFNKNDLYILKYVARLTPCKWETDCDDPECIYGHRCSQSEIGKKDCWYKDHCWFPTSMHGIDTKVVKTVNVR